MRALTLIPLLVLAACSGENQGWNPNYRANATPYGDYLRGRELALTGQRAEPPRVIPVALPVRAPTPAQIAGFAVALRAKGETIAEIKGLADVMVSKATPITLPQEAVDVVGSGGDLGLLHG